MVTVTLSEGVEAIAKIRRMQNYMNIFMPNPLASSSKQAEGRDGAHAHHPARAGCRADNAELLQALPSANLESGEILEALRQSRAEH